jgi:nucleoside-diphosphate-sugar epimerase
MGGAGFIFTGENDADIMHNSATINLNVLDAAYKRNISRIFYSSSACAYNTLLQQDPKVRALKESDAYPAMAERGYGWEKLVSEMFCQEYWAERGMKTAIARFHNVYGPWGTWDGGREKAPAAICRKVLQAKFTGKHEIEIWGDGQQTRSFMYIDDCLHGTQMLTHSDFIEPINIGSSELVSINQLVDIVEEIASIRLHRSYNLSAPKGVNGRNSDNTLIQSAFGWEPSTRLKDGLAKTYAWIHDQMAPRYR